MKFYYVALADRTVAPTTLADPNHWTYMADSEGRNPVAMSNDENNYTRSTTNTFNNNLDITYNAPFLSGLKITRLRCFRSFKQ